MKFFIHFLLISSLSIIIAEGIEHHDECQMETFIREGPPSCIGLPDTIKLLEGGQIFRNYSTVVWKGKYKDTVDVAIKLFNDNEGFEREKQAYERLNATAVNFDFMTHRIPRIYYHGRIFRHFDAIVMTLFEDNLENHFERQDGHFSDSTILLIFKQVVEGLKYIHSKGVLHNHIQLSNVFIHGQRLFIADFDISYLNETEYLSSDYASLFETVWRMVHTPVHFGESEPVNLACFKDPTVQIAFRDILDTDYIQRGNITLPDYDKIITIADKAIAQIATKSEPVQFDWLKTGNNPSLGESSRQGKNSR